MYKSIDSRVYYKDKYICSLSAPFKVDQTRRDGESWLDMRNRVRPLFNDKDRMEKKMASIVAEALNSADLTKD